jgi:hypothetical protein
MNRTRKPMWRQPFAPRIGGEKRAVNALGRRAQHAVKLDAVGHGGLLFVFLETKI